MTMKETSTSASSTHSREPSTPAADPAAPTATTLPKPYSALWHPEKTWTDIFLSYIVGWLLGFKGAATVAPDATNEESLQRIQTIRAALNKITVMVFKSSRSGPFFLWSKTVSSQIVDYAYQIPVASSVLEDWGFSFDHQALQLTPPLNDNTNENEDTITVRLFFPASILSADDASKFSTDTNALGCVQVKDSDNNSIDLSQLSTDVAIIIFFHGGGLTIGDAYDPEGVLLVQKIAAMMPNDTSSMPIVLASVEYGLAPERSFPTAASQALTVVEHFCALLPLHKIHIAGISAGGNLATVATMEAVRKFPGRVRSALISCPMLDPATNSLSVHLNSQSSHGCPVDFLRWCWQAYLQLPVSPDSHQTTTLLDGSETHEELLSVGSNRTTWDASQWKTSSLARLVNPLLDLPTESLKGTESAEAGTSTATTTAAPTFIIQTNRGDPLHDDGVALVDRLTAIGAKVTHIDAGGSHFMGLKLEPATEKAMLEAWLEAIAT
jgi:acetyl esterase/lipase